MRTKRPTAIVFAPRAAATPHRPAGCAAEAPAAAKPHHPRPYETADLTATFFQPDRGFVTAGIGYDPANRLLYIVQLAGDRDSGRYEAHPVIHVWRINKATTMPARQPAGQNGVAGK